MSIEMNKHSYHDVWLLTVEINIYIVFLQSDAAATFFCFSSLCEYECGVYLVRGTYKASILVAKIP